MQADIEGQIAGLPKLPLGRLRRRYAELFGQQTGMRNKSWLVKRVAWGLQAQAEGGLSERARRRAEQLAHDASVRLVPTKVASPPERDGERASLRPARDPRLPAPGTLITRRYMGRVLQVPTKGFGYASYMSSSFPKLPGANAVLFCFLVLSAR